MARRKESSFDVDERKWYRLGYVDRHECCDCGLVHDIAYKLHRGQIFERWQRNDSATARARRKRKAD